MSGIERSLSVRANTLDFVYNIPVGNCGSVFKGECICDR